MAGSVWFYGIWNIVSYLMPDLFLYIKTILNKSVWYKDNFFVYSQLNVKTVQFQTIQFSIQYKNSSI